MPENRQNRELIARLAGEILSHTNFLLDTSLDIPQRDRLLRIQSLTRTLESLLSDGAQKRERSAASAAAARHGVQGGDPGMAPLQILLVEDNPFTQKLISRVLALRGHSVKLAIHGQEALEMLEEEEYDLVLMDIRMPVMDGIQAVVAIRQWEQDTGRPRIPVIAVTALANEETRARAREAGMDGFHGKPVRAKILFAEMDRVLGEIRPAMRKGVDPELIELDMERMLTTVDGDWALLAEVTGIYLTDAPKQLSRIKKALALPDFTELREAAHSLKGASGAFGKNLVFDLALALEQAGRKENRDNAPELIEKLEQAVARMRKTLITEIGKHGVKIK